MSSPSSGRKRRSHNTSVAILKAFRKRVLEPLARDLADWERDGFNDGGVTCTTLTSALKSSVATLAAVDEMQLPLDMFRRVYCQWNDLDQRDESPVKERRHLQAMLLNAALEELTRCLKRPDVISGGNRVPLAAAHSIVRNFHSPHLAKLRRLRKALGKYAAIPKKLNQSELGGFGISKMPVIQGR